MTKNPKPSPGHALPQADWDKVVADAAEFRKALEAEEAEREAREGG